MGKIVVEKKTKKKKGRPSLLDLQKRQLKLQNNSLSNNNNNINNKIIIKNNKNNINDNKNNINDNNNITTPNSLLPRPNSTSDRSRRRNPNSDGKLLDDGGGEGEDEEDGGLEGGEVDYDEEREVFGENGGRKRKIDLISSRSDGVKLQVEKQSIAVTNQTSNEQGSSKQDDGPLSTPLPDKKLLLFILDSLQKKDTYGVYAEPVDPEELPDYHEIIKHPMDFGTVRKKLEEGAYGYMEQFETDIFLICSNAMQYNSPDSIYFRQARSIQELARKNFDNLRQDSDDNEVAPEPKVVRRGRPPKNLKRPPGKPPLERVNSDFSDANLATAGGSTTRLNEPRKRPSYVEKYGSTGSFARTSSGSRNNEGYANYTAKRSERSDDLIGSTSKGYSMKHWKKQIVVDENRRNTYQNSSALPCEPSVLTTFQKERKQLMAIGLHSEYGYARSLARFAAKLGPVAWKVASKKIEKCLPAGTKFGQGWVGENEAPSERLPQQLPDASDQSSVSASAPHDVMQSNDGMSEQKSCTEHLSDMHMPTHHPKANNESNNAASTPEAGRNSASVSSPTMLSNGTDSEPNLISPETCTPSSPRPMVNMVSSSTGPMVSGNKVQIHQTSTVQSHLNGTNGSYGHNFAGPMGKNIDAAKHPSVVTESHPDDNRCEEAKSPVNSSPVKASGRSPNTRPHQKVGLAPADLNIGFQSSGSSGSAQPDLALQL